MAELFPSLIFTKAELVHIVTNLLTQIDDNDNETRLEMVEMRHYCNEIKAEIAALAASRALSCKTDETLSIKEEKPVETPSGTTPKPVPTLAELHRQFPTLSLAEIKDILDKAKEEQERLKAETKDKGQKVSPIKMPNFIAKSEEELYPNAKPPKDAPPKVKTAKDLADEENTRKFVELLGP